MKLAILFAVGTVGFLFCSKGGLRKTQNWVSDWIAEQAKPSTLQDLHLL